MFFSLLVFLIFSTTAFANYRYNSTYFRFIGDIFYERTLNFQFHGGSAYFSVEGKGEVSGIITSQEKEFRRSPAASVYRITALNLNAYIKGTTALDAMENEKLLIMSVIELPVHNLEMATGVQMNPGETGFINHDIVSSNSSEGKYLRMYNHFGNTGGTTKRILEIPGYLEEKMRVDGYAEVWDFTEMYDGEHRSGFWDMLP